MECTCCICGYAKNASAFFRTDMEHNRCRECCPISRFCEHCRRPHILMAFKGSSRRCTPEWRTPLPTHGTDMDADTDTIAQFNQWARDWGVPMSL